FFASHLHHLCAQLGWRRHEACTAVRHKRHMLVLGGAWIWACWPAFQWFFHVAATPSLRHNALCLSAALALWAVRAKALPGEPRVSTGTLLFLGFCALLIAAKPVLLDLNLLAAAACVTGSAVLLAAL